MKVHFFQPRQFNRTERGTNPFFDPLIEVCRKNGIAYKVFVDDFRPRCGYGRGRVGSGWILTWGSIVLWKLSRRWFRGDENELYRRIGAVLNLVTFGHYRADVCITVAGIHLEILAGIAPGARLVDLQHGVIYPGHPGYFDARGKALPRLRNNARREFWLYGRGYRDCFFHDESNRRLLEGRVHIVGDVVRAGRREGRGAPRAGGAERKALVLALQFVSDASVREARQMREVWERFLDAARDDVLRNGLRVVARHHPRFSPGRADLSGWRDRYPWIGEDGRPWPELLRETLACVTINSTVAFDAAAEGVPTIFLDAREIGMPDIFRICYHYPLANPGLRALLSQTEAERAASARALGEWFAGFYTPFSEGKALELLRGAPAARGGPAPSSPGREGLVAGAAGETPPGAGAPDCGRARGPGCPAGKAEGRRG